jgi:hypothetical protein
MNVYQHPRLGKLIKDKPVVEFKNLPVDFQRAIIHYMAVDGAAWAVYEWEDWRWGEGKPIHPKFRAMALADIEKSRHRFIESWGNVRFGCCTMTPESLIESINGDEELVNHGWKYTVTGSPDTSEYDFPTWPVFLSSFHDETLQDGWKRFKNYCQRNWLVPVTWYVE